MDTLIACRLRSGIYSGIVPDGIADLVTGDVDWAGDSTVLLSYVKGRTATAPRVQRNDRDILNLLNKHAKVLHLAPAAASRMRSGP